MKSLTKLYKVGPGPSSSHTMGPMYAVKDYLEKYPQANSFEVILFGSLALTGKGHFTDQIIIKTFSPKKVDIIWKPLEFLPEHPNAMLIKGISKTNEFESIKYFSVGGGAIMINSMNGSPDKNIYEEKTLKEMISICIKKKISIYEYAISKEENDFLDYMDNIFNTMINGVDIGLNQEGELPGTLKILRRAKRMLNIPVIDPQETRTRKVAAYAFAMSEVNASLGMIVTAPTCGAAGVIPAIVYYLYNDLKKDKKDIINALITAGIIGNFIKTNATISGAEGGCQAEVGSASSMGSALLAQLFYNDLDIIERSAAIGLEHFLGLTCDPVGGYVIIPCIERNAVAANTAFSSVSIAYCSEGTDKMPFDTVVQVMKETGKDLKKEYKETSLGGLAKYKNNLTRD